MILHDGSSGTIVHGVSFFCVAPLPLLWHCDFFVVDAFAMRLFSNLGTSLRTGSRAVHTSMISYPTVGMDS